MFGTVDTWLIYHLTKEKAFVSDITNASRTYFMDLETLDYDDDLLDFWGIDPTKIRMPKIVSSSEFYGEFAAPKLDNLGFHNKITKEAYDILKTITGCQSVVVLVINLLHLLVNWHSVLVLPNVLMVLVLSFYITLDLIN